MKKYRLWLLGILLLTPGCGFLAGAVGLSGLNPFGQNVGQSQTTVQVTPSQGGTIQSENLSVVIPPNATDTETKLTVDTTAFKKDELEADVQPLSPVYKVKAEHVVALPADTTTPIHISLSYDPQKVPADKQTAANIHAIFWNGQEWIPVFGDLDKEKGSLIIPLLELPAQELKMAVVQDDKYKMVTADPETFTTQAEISNKKFRVLYYDEGFFSEKWRTISSGNRSPEEAAKLTLKTLNEALDFYRSHQFKDPQLARDRSGQYIATIYKSSRDLPLQSEKKQFSKWIFFTDSTPAYYNNLDINILHNNSAHFVEKSYQELIAHELFHAVQASYKNNFGKTWGWQENCQESGDRTFWLTEGTAQAMAGYWYRKEPFIAYSANPTLPYYRLFYPLNKADYNIGLEYTIQDFWTFLEKKIQADTGQSPQVIHTIYDKIGNLNRTASGEITCQSERKLISSIEFVDRVLQEKYGQSFQQRYTDFVRDRAYFHRHNMDDNDKNLQSNRIYTAGSISTVINQNTLQNQIGCDKPRLEFKEELPGLSVKVYRFLPTCSAQSLRLTLENSNAKIHWYTYIDNDPGLQKTKQLYQVDNSKESEKTRIFKNVSDNNDNVVVIVVNTNVYLKNSGQNTDHVALKAELVKNDETSFGNTGNIPLIVE